MSVETKKDIITQQNQVLEQDFKVELYASCTVGNGILRADEQMIEDAKKQLAESEIYPHFFIPASGSGSRMFKFLFQWLEDGVETKEIKRFFRELPNFPFYNELNENASDRKSLVEEIVANYSSIPKGLIPFHQYEDEVRTAFQEHLVQVKDFFGENVKVHFTIQKDFENAIRNNIGEQNNVSFSFQNDETDAYCFDANGEIVKENGEYLRRPAGHGALLENLNTLDADVVLIKNIDNVQRFSKSSPSGHAWKLAMGIVLNFKKELKLLSADYSFKKLQELNKRYQFLSKEDELNFCEDDLARIISQPTRVCGMVKNEGEPGGGPFWIKDKDGISKQIIEKAQIKDAENQQEIVQKSSHFNPVFIVASKTNVLGETLDITKFRDDAKYFVVKKTHKGKEIFYRELPGLWNGSMNYWNTIFLELPSDVFTPVKSVLDLLR